LKLSNSNPAGPASGVAPGGGRGLKLRSLKNGKDCTESPPAGGRGLKLGIGHPKFQGPYVAPRRGAWIETSRRR